MLRHLTGNIVQSSVGSKTTDIFACEHVSLTKLWMRCCLLHKPNKIPSLQGVNLFGLSLSISFLQSNSTTNCRWHVINKWPHINAQNNDQHANIFGILWCYSFRIFFCVSNNKILFCSFWMTDWRLNWLIGICLECYQTCFATIFSDKQISSQILWVGWIATRTYFPKRAVFLNNNMKELAIIEFSP